MALDGARALVFETFGTAEHARRGRARTGS